MKNSFNPGLNKIYVFERHSVLFINTGSGSFQVDFRNYEFAAGKVIFLSPGQYFRLTSGSFDMTSYEFSNENIRQLENSRFLFKHLVSLAHVDLFLPKQFQLKQSRYPNMPENMAELLTSAIDDWKLQDPFKASEQEINMLFDIKDIIDDHYYEPIPVIDYLGALKEKPYKVQQLTRKKLNATVSFLANKRLLLEAQRKVVFTDFSTKQIAYELGFKDPAYFNRYFKVNTKKTPSEFRNEFDYENADPVLNDLFDLIEQYYKTYHFAEFYAARLSLTEKTLSRRIADKLGTTLNRLIKARKLREAFCLLQQHIPVSEISRELGFEEPNHFSTFFKASTGKTPTEFSSHF
ncbi:MAG TPA: helix-turn-helix domain-containing protein [Mucilaginibacter sp.]|jgi:AraC-like DNA-binding protein|nr:helix-turn-helix domain-containing protein [Mucilaginibacter sp.]